ncbi:MAG: NADH-quinone oxidoreductase subunit H [Candidatus Saccharibacteria bacterium]|nr:NADH-quinone oxidoreductase subunit H [Candidatus Saccharibacteria bacterium]
MISVLSSVIQTVLVILAAPLTVGLIRKIKARLQNRQGASVFQPYWALLSLWRKQMTITKYSSWVFHAVPFVVFATSTILALCIPALGTGSWTAQQGNLFLLATALAVGSMFLVLGGMDVASTFGGMGASREMTLAALIEPAVIITFTTLGTLANTWNFDGILHAASQTPWLTSHPFFLLTILSFICVLLAENARYPVDNPATHLELTMVHEAMILEYSGPYLAILEAASAIKLTVLGLLLMNLIFPFFLTITSPLGALASLAGFSIKLLLAAALIAGIETVFVKMRFYRMQEYMTVAYFLGLAGLILSIAF